MSKHPNDKLLSEIKNVVQLRKHPEFDIIKILSHQEIVESTPRAIEYVMNPWLPLQGIAFVYAATGVGKTMFTLNVAYAIAAGGRFLKYTSSLPRKVLYVDGEMAYSQVHARYMQIVKQQGELFFKDNFHLLTPEKALARLPKVCSAEGQEFYNKRIEELGIEVLVLDNLSTLSAIDENNSEQWKVIQDWLISLRSKGITIIVVHHAGKDKRGYRGTSRMLDIADTAISLQDVSDNEMESEVVNSKKFKIEYQKNRSFGGKDAMAFEVSLNSEGWEFDSMEKNNTNRIVSMINLKMKPADISLELGISKSYVYRMIKEARRKGMIID